MSLKILVEHVIFSPYTGTIHGGAEKSTYLAVEALKQAGHEVTLLAPEDSTLPCLKAPVKSGQYVAKHGGVMKMKQWYEFIRRIHGDYDVILLNHGLTSQSILDPKHAPWLAKSTYINRDASAWYSVGGAGLRLILNLKWLRYCGGTAWYMSSANAATLQQQWDHPVRGQQARTWDSKAGQARIGHTDWFDIDLFDGFYNQAVCPPDIQPARASEGYAITVARPDPWKRLTECAREAKRLGLRHVVCTTSQNTSDKRSVAGGIIQKLRDLGSEVLLDLPHDQVMHHIAGAETMVHLAKNESFCNAVWEAIAHGVPIHTSASIPALDLFPQLRGTSTTQAERQAVQQQVKEHTLVQLGERLTACFPQNETNPTRT